MRYSSFKSEIESHFQTARRGISWKDRVISSSIPATGLTNITFLAKTSFAVLPFRKSKFKIIKQNFKKAAKICISS